MVFLFVLTVILWLITDDLRVGHPDKPRRGS